MDAFPQTKRGEVDRESQIEAVDLRRKMLEEALPAHFVSDYPQFVEFLTVYYEYLEADEGLDRLIERLRNVRNPDIAKEENADKLRAEYGAGIPEFGTLTDANAIRIFETWYQSRGNKDAMEAYFRIFLNTDAEVVYPRDNMLVVDGGNWDDTSSRYTDQDGHLDEVTMVIQDDVYYQVYSYLIRSGVSIADWGPTFRAIAHPAGWNLFGEVRLTELARFEQYELVTDAGARSPTVVPGFQTKDANLLILGAALFFAVGQFDPASQARQPVAFAQFIRKYWDVVLVKSTGVHSVEDVSKRIMASTYTIGGLKDLTLGQFRESESETHLTPLRRPARIVITT